MVHVRKGGLAALSPGKKVGTSPPEPCAPPWEAPWGIPAAIGAIKTAGEEISEWRTCARADSLYATREKKLDTTPRAMRTAMGSSVGRASGARSHQNGRRWNFQTAPWRQNRLPAFSLGTKFDTHPSSHQSGRQRNFSTAPVPQNGLVVRNPAKKWTQPGRAPRRAVESSLQRPSGNQTANCRNLFTPPVLQSGFPPSTPRN